MNKYILSFSVLMLSLVCCNFKNTKKESIIDDISFEEIFGSKGVVVFNNDGQYTIKNDWNLYNKDGSFYCKISFYNHLLIIEKDSLNLYDFETDPERKNKYDFNPKLFYPETGAIVQFECKNLYNDTLELYVNKEKNIVKYTKLDTTIFKFQSWEEHLKKAFIVFDVNKNPIKSIPDGVELKYSDSLNYTFMMTEIKGEWMKLECKNICEDCKDGNKYNGWIKWRNGKKILIELFYVC